MAFPNWLRKKLTPLLKDGASLPDELEEGVYFENGDAFAAAAAAKAKPSISEAEKKAREQGEAQLREILKKFGTDDPDKLDGIIQAHAEASGKLTEHEKLAADFAKLQKDTAKEIKRLSEENQGLSGFRTTVLKTNALTPHLAKIHPDFRPMVSKLVLADLVLGEKDVVTAPEGKGIDAHIDELIKATPSLKAPDFKAGAGTGANGSKTTTPSNGDGGSNGQNGQTDLSKMSFGQAFATVMKEKAEAGQQGGGNT